MKIRTKMMLLLGGATLVACGVMGGTAALQARQSALDDAKKQVDEIAKHYQADIQAQLNHAMDNARTVALSIEGYQANSDAPSRSDINAMLKNALYAQPDLLGLYTCWEPDAFDRKDADFASVDEAHDDTGRFVPYWSWGDTDVSVVALVDYDTPGAGDYYLNCRNSKNEVVLDPYLYPINGEDVLLTSLVAPITGQGKFLGMAGVDISLKSLGEMAKDIQSSGEIYNTGSISIISQGGLYVAHADDERLGQPIAEFEPWFESSAADIADAFAKGQTFHVGTAYPGSNGKLDQIAVPIQIGKSTTPWTLLITIPEREITAAADSLLMTILAISLTATAVLLALIFFLSKNLTHPITQMGKHLQMMGGDLTKRLDASRQDELGDLARWFNTFVEKTQSVIGEVKGMTAEVTTASSSIASSAEELSACMDSQNHDAEQIDQTLSNLTASINVVSSQLGEAAQSADAAGSRAEEGADAAQQTADGMSAVSQSVSTTAGSIQSLGQRGEEIGQVITVINDIADQTNLLALNAAIEAARAGEHGRGFAVVADEVRKLADRTTVATKEIGTSIQAIQEETDSAVAQITEGAEQAEQGMNLATNAREQLDSIKVSAQEVSNAIQTLSASAQEQSELNAAVAESSVNIRRSADESTQATHHVSQAAHDLTTKAQTLEGLMEQFTV